MARKRPALYKLRYKQVPAIVVIAAVVAVVAVFSVININLDRDINRLNALVEQGNALVLEKQKEAAMLLDTLQISSTDGYIANQARTQYGYLAPGEIRFVITNPEALYGPEGASAPAQP